MKPAPFDYVRADSVAHALQHIRDAPDAKFIAGGQSLLAMMNFRLARPAGLIDLGGLGELARMFAEDDSLLLGAMCTHRELETSPQVRRRLPLVAEAVTHVGHVAIRNRGTLGGTLAHADPAAELPAALMALDASVFAERLGADRREIPVTDLFGGFYTTRLDEDELITWVRIPEQPQGSGWGFAETSRRHGDFAEAGTAVTVQLSESGRVQAIRLCLFGVADRPLLVADVDSVLERLPSSALWTDLAQQTASALEPMEQPAYRRRLAATCISRACEQATTRARAAKARERGGDQHA